MEPGLRSLTDPVSALSPCRVVPLLEVGQATGKPGCLQIDVADPVGSELSISGGMQAEVIPWQTHRMGPQASRWAGELMSPTLP